MATKHSLRGTKESRMALKDPITLYTVTRCMKHNDIQNLLEYDLDKWVLSLLLADIEARCDPKMGHICLCNGLRSSNWSFEQFDAICSEIRQKLNN